MKLIAKKPCSFGGKRFYINQEIPAELVVNPREQEKLGVIAIAGEDEKVETIVNTVDVDMVSVTVPVDEGDLVLKVTREGLQSMVNILIGTVEEAEPVIEGMTDGAALFLLYLTDSRKGVKTAAEARGKALEEAGEQ